MNKVISTILDIIAFLLIASIFVMFIAWALQQVPGRTTSVKEARTVQEETQEESQIFNANSHLISSSWIESEDSNSPQLFKITCFTKVECPTEICQSGRIKIGDVALNPKHGRNKIIQIGNETYEAKWISSYDTDIDIWFGEDWDSCKEFGVKYLEVIIN